MFVLLFLGSLILDQVGQRTIESSILKMYLTTSWESFSYARRKVRKKIGKNWNLNSWNLSQIILCSLRERSCFNSYYNYPCKYLIISTTKIYFQNFEKRKWTIWSNNFFQPRQLITKANQVGVRDQRIKLVKQLKDIYARYIVTIWAFMYSSINLWTHSRIKYC